MGLGKRPQELNAADRLKALKYYERLNKMERIEDFKDDIKVSEWHPRSGGEVERRQELDIIGRVVGLLERVVPRRMPRVHKAKNED